MHPVVLNTRSLLALLAGMLITPMATYHNLGNIRRHTKISQCRNNIPALLEKSLSPHHLTLLPRQRYMVVVDFSLLRWHLVQVMIT